MDILRNSTEDPVAVQSHNKILCTKHPRRGRCKKIVTQQSVGERLSKVGRAPVIQLFELAVTGYFVYQCKISDGESFFLCTFFKCSASVHEKLRTLYSTWSTVATDEDMHWVKLGPNATNYSLSTTVALGLYFTRHILLSIVTSDLLSWVCVNNPKSDRAA